MWLVVINPHSGNGRGATVAERVTRYLSERGVRYQSLASDSAAGLSLELRQTIAGGEYEGLISVGGDGLAHLVMQHAVPHNLPFLVIPAGTGNDFVRTLGWSL